MRFRSLASFTAFNIDFDVVLNCGTPIVSEYVTYSLEVTVVSSERCVMMMQDNVATKSLVVWNVNAILVS